MKKTVTFLLLLMISVGFGLQSCEKKTENYNQKETQETKKINADSVSQNKKHPQNKEKNNIILGEDLPKINAYAKKIYKKDGIIYIDLDLVEFRYPTEGEWDESDREIVNNNPKIRTYIIDNDTSIYSNICKEVTASELFQIRESVLHNKSIIVIGSSKNGNMLEINFGCYG
jgi:hypothetical protein